MSIEKKIGKNLQNIGDSLSGDEYYLSQVFSNEIIQECSSAKNAEELFKRAGIIRSGLLKRQGCMTSEKSI